MSALMIFYSKWQSHHFAIQTLWFKLVECWGQSFPSLARMSEQAPLSLLAMQCGISKLVTEDLPASHEIVAEIVKIVSALIPNAVPIAKADLESKGTERLQNMLLSTAVTLLIFRTIWDLFRLLLQLVPALLFGED
jgi:hypothetical protein